MSLNPELDRKLRDPRTADAAMAEAAAYLIGQPGIRMEEIAQMTELLPFLNTVPAPIAEEILSRAKLTHDILPGVREFLGSYLRQLGFAGANGLDTLTQCRELAVDSLPMAQIAFNLVHGMLGQVEELASAMNMPTREFQAALARTGIETAVFLIEKSHDSALKRYAKTNLLYFADIEMLSLGCRTNAYQFAFVDPEHIRPELLKHPDQIMPIITVDESLKGPLAFGQIEVTDNIPSGVDGINFLYPGS